jgi:hypothetical protein
MLVVINGILYYLFECEDGETMAKSGPGL